jgi:hypothetical protein
LWLRSEDCSFQEIIKKNLQRAGNKISSLSNEREEYKISPFCPFTDGNADNYRVCFKFYQKKEPAVEKRHK